MAATGVAAVAKDVVATGLAALAKGMAATGVAALAKGAVAGMPAPTASKSRPSTSEPHHIRQVASSCGPCVRRPSFAMPPLRA